MPSPQASRRDLVVTIEDSHLSSIGSVADKMTAAGLTQQRTLPTAGIVTGSVDEAAIARLKKVAAPDAGVQ